MTKKKNEIPEIKIRLVSSPVIAKTKKLNHTWTSDEDWGYQDYKRKLKVGSRISMWLLGGDSWFIIKSIKNKIAEARSGSFCCNLVEVKKDVWRNSFVYWNVNAYTQLVKVLNAHIKKKGAGGEMPAPY